MSSELTVLFLAVAAVVAVAIVAIVAQLLSHLRTVTEMKRVNNELVAIADRLLNLLEQGSNETS